MILPFDPTNPPVCDMCKAAPASIQFVEQKGGETRRISLCASCGSKQGISHDGNSVTFNLPGLLAAMGGMTSATQVSHQCAACGLTTEEFRATGRLGCARCYEAFAEMLEPIIKKVQAGTAHRGLAPARLGPLMEKQTVAALRRQLDEAVAAERYEEAIALRDKIRELERSL